MTQETHEMTRPLSNVVRGQNTLFAARHDPHDPWSSAIHLQGWPCGEHDALNGKSSVLLLLLWLLSNVFVLLSLRRGMA